MQCILPIIKKLHKQRKVNICINYAEKRLLTLIFFMAEFYFKILTPEIRVDLILHLQYIETRLPSQINNAMNCSRGCDSRGSRGRQAVSADTPGTFRAECRRIMDTCFCWQAVMRQDAGSPLGLRAKHKTLGCTGRDWHNWYASTRSPLKAIRAAIDCCNSVNTCDFMCIRADMTRHFCAF